MTNEEVARAVATDYLQHSGGRGSGCNYHTDLNCLTARILAALNTVQREEREKCAKVADTWPELKRHSIAAAIRSQKG